jgi:predicted nucleotidyltransferase
MRALTEKEKKIVLLLAKDFTTDYNARSLSRKVGMSPRGALKALKFLEQNGIARGRQVGKSIIYRLVYDEYSQMLVAEFLLDESRTKAQRWIREFSEFRKAKALVLFGSAIRSGTHNDIDLLIIVEKKDYDTLYKLVKAKNDILVKPIHPVWQTRSDMVKNILKRDAVVLEIIKTGIVLKGNYFITEVLASVSRRE